MTTKLLIAGMVVLNVLLGAAVWQQSAESKAYAQMGVPKRDLLIVNGVSAGNSYIFMLDLSTGVMSVGKPDPIQGRIQLVDNRIVSDDLARVK